MKKIIYSLLFAFGVLSAMPVMAATAIVPSANITAGDCVLLSDTVQIGLSSDVHGAYQCDELTNTIKIATCHEAGSRKETTQQCAVVDSTTTPVTYNDPSCGSTSDTFTFIDYRAYVASSSGGQVAIADLGGNCSDGQVTGLQHFN